MDDLLLGTLRHSDGLISISPRPSITVFHLRTQQTAIHWHIVSSASLSPRNRLVYIVIVIVTHHEERDRHFRPSILLGWEASRWGSIMCSTPRGVPLTPGAQQWQYNTVQVTFDCSSRWRSQSRTLNVASRQETYVTCCSIINSVHDRVRKFYHIRRIVLIMPLQFL
jgi:hypothetical protein